MYVVVEEKGLEEVPVSELHNIVEQVLEEFNPVVASRIGITATTRRTLST